MQILDLENLGSISQAIDARLTTKQGWGQIHKVKYKYEVLKKYQIQIQICELENIQIGLQIQIQYINLMSCVCWGV